MSRLEPRSQVRYLPALYLGRVHPTFLHVVAVGNMLPAFVESGGDEPRPLTTICVDQTEFVVNQLPDRTTHQSWGVVTNPRDFMHVLPLYRKRWEQSNRS